MNKLTIKISLTEFEKQRTLSNFRQYLENAEAEIVSETDDSICIRSKLGLSSNAFFVYLSRACLKISADAIIFSYSNYRTDLPILAVLFIIYYKERLWLLLIPGLFLLIFANIAGRRRYKKMLMDVIFLESNKNATL